MEHSYAKPGNIAGVQSLRFGRVVANIHSRLDTNLPWVGGHKLPKAHDWLTPNERVQQSLAESDRRMGKGTVPGLASDAGHGQLGLEKSSSAALLLMDLE